MAIEDNNKSARQGNVDPRILSIDRYQKNAWSCLHTDDYAAGAEYAIQLLRLVSDPTLSDFLADRANSLHCAFTVLGANAWSEGVFDLAIGCLHRSAAVGQSPHLASFGPSMFLANKLLLTPGSFDEVLKFLEYCQLFWLSGSSKLALWKAALDKRQIPDFGVNIMIGY
jgi:hypothetical protein